MYRHGVRFNETTRRYHVYIPDSVITILDVTKGQDKYDDAVKMADHYDSIAPERCPIYEVNQAQARAIYYMQPDAADKPPTDTDMLDWLESNSTTGGSFETIDITINVGEDYEGAPSIRDVILHAMKLQQEAT